MKYNETINVLSSEDIHLHEYGNNNTERSSSCKIRFEGVWENKECIRMSGLNFKEKLNLGITLDEIFGKINRPYLHHLTA